MRASQKAKSKRSIHDISFDELMRLGSDKEFRESLKDEAQDMQKCLFTNLFRNLTLRKQYLMNLKKRQKQLI